MDVSPDGSQIAVGTNEYVHLFNFADGSLRHTFDSYGMQVAFSPDGHQLAIAENLPVIRIWNLDNYEELYTLPGHGFSIAYSSDGTLFAAPGWNNQGMAAFLGAEKFATTAGGENEVQVWNMVNGNHVRAMNTHRLSRVSDGNEVASVKVGNNVDSVAFSPDGTTVAIRIYKTLYLWPIENVIKKK
nr:hypothetical protein [Kallotenue papyrolyticum]